MRILYASNAPWSPSGYGVQGGSLLPRLRDLPEVEDIGIFAWYGLQGGIWEWNGFKIYPMHREPYGNDMYRNHADDFKADVVITLIDAWVLKGLAEKLDPIEWWPWFPIDHEPVSPHNLQALQGAKKKLVYSKSAQKLLAEVGVEDTIYIPHGIEVDKFKVLEPGEVRQQFRNYHFGQDAEFVVTMVAANKGEDDRKAFGYQLQAFARFAKDKPGVRLWMHTTPGQESKGVGIGSMLHLLNIADKVRFPIPYQYAMGYPVDWMSALYNSSDVFLGAAKAEGFGIPLIEAQACGLPIITSNFSSQPELVRWGITVPILALEWCHLGAWRSIPSVDGIHEALETLYEEWLKEKSWPVERRLAASEAIHSEFGWDSVVENYWHPLIKESGL
jgi:glycosyltransferase involved in cell wall biosynthesis